MDEEQRDRSPDSSYWIIAAVGGVAAVGVLMLIRIRSQPRAEIVDLAISAAQLPPSSVELAEPMAAKEPDVTVAARTPPAPAPGTTKPAASMRARATIDIVTIESALEHYAVNNSHRYPESFEVLVTPDVNGQTYLNATEMPKDPWGNDYVYEPPVNEPRVGTKRPRILCLGADGREGGTGDDADLDNLTIRGIAPK